MPQQGKTLGTDITLKIVGPNGKLDFINSITNFTKSQITNRETRKYLDSSSAHLVFFDGWQGTFELDRTGPALERYFMSQEAAFNRGEDLFRLTITETIREADGSVTQNIYTDVSLTLTNGGSFARDSVVSQTIEWMGSRGQAIS